MGQERYPGLQLDEDLLLQKREWKLQRVARVFSYTLLAAIILGLLGNGPLSHSFKGTEDGPIVIEPGRIEKSSRRNVFRFVFCYDDYNIFATMTARTP